VAGLVVPALDERPWPTLGPQVCDFLLAYGIHGPGDLKGERVRLDDEKRALFYRAYEVYPTWHPLVQAGRMLAGRRRFKLVTWMKQKGTGKTEDAGMIMYVELDPEGPVRFDGWDAHGEPVGRPVVDPYIPCFAFTEEQAEGLAFNALYTMVSEGPRADLYDIGLKRIMRKDGDGKAEARSSAPSAADGALTSFGHVDESHRWILEHHRETYRVHKTNLPKRFAADAWNLTTTTAYRPGQGSVAEMEHDYARAVAAGKIKNPTIFFFHRGASDEHDSNTEEGFRAMVIEAAGPSASWRDIESIVAQWHDPTADRAYLEQVWGGRVVKQGMQAFDPVKWQALRLGAAAQGEANRAGVAGDGGPGALADRIRQALGTRPHPNPLPEGEGIPLPEGLEWTAEGSIRPIEGEAIALGFDGSRWHDSTAIVGTHLRTRFQWKQGFWERPASLPKAVQWEVPADEVKAAFAQACIRWRLARAYCDPPYWETEIAEWAGTYGSEKVVFWYTARDRAMAYAVRGYGNAILEGLICHDGDADLAAHLGHARKRTVNVFDDQAKGQPLFVLTKERPDSVMHIDLAVAGTLSNEACNDAIADGFSLDDRSVYEEMGLFI
jgi:hypothetical protein